MDTIDVQKLQNEKTQCPFSISLLGLQLHNGVRSLVCNCELRSATLEPCLNCSEAKAWWYVDPKWCLFHSVRKRYPPTRTAPIRIFVAFRTRFRPDRPRIEVKGRSETARMGWRRGLNRNKIWYFGGLHSPKQAYFSTNGVITICSLRWRWNSYAGNCFSWIFLLFCLWTSVFGLQVLTS